MIQQKVLLANMILLINWVTKIKIYKKIYMKKSPLLYRNFQK